MYISKYNKFRNEELREVLFYFSDLKNLKDFLNKDERDCKSNKAGTIANVRTRFGIVTIHLSKQEIEIKGKIAKTVITIYSKEINLVAVFTIEWKTYESPWTDFQYEIYLAPNLNSSSPRFLQELKKIFVIEPIIDNLEEKIEYKIIELVLKSKMN